MYYDKNNMDYIRERLCSCIVNTTDGEPLYISSVRDAGFVEGYYLKDLPDDPMEAIKEKIYVRVLIDNVDLMPVKLGCVNYNEKVYWVSRQPIRDWKQGLSNKNIRGWSGGIAVFKPLYYTIKGIYPSFEEAQIDIGRSLGSKAFSRNFHLQYPNIICYKQKPVGVITNGMIEWNAGSSFLNDRFLKAVSK